MNYQFVASLLLTGFFVSSCATSGTAPLKSHSPKSELKQKATAWRGHHYWLADYTLTWPEVAAFARNAGGHLVIIDTVGENAFLTQRLDSDFTFIGIYRAGPAPLSPWITVTGEPIAYSNWLPGEGGNADQYFGGIDRGGHWHDVFGHEAHKFFVEWDN